MIVQMSHKMLLEFTVSHHYTVMSVYILLCFYFQIIFSLIFIVCVVNMIIFTFHFVGLPRVIHFPFCSCECDAIKLIRCGYWPGTPVTPFVAFSFEFMNLLDSLLVECHVPVQDFTQAWSYLISKKLC